MSSWTYSYRTGVDGAITRGEEVLVEVLGNREAHEEGEPDDELRPEAVQVAELEEPEPRSSCDNKLKSYQLDPNLEIPDNV